MLSVTTDEELDRRIAEARSRGFGALAALAPNLPLYRRRAILVEMVEHPLAEDDQLFRIASLAREVPHLVQRRLVDRCRAFLERKTGNWPSSDDGCDVVTLLGALDAAERAEWLEALERTSVDRSPSWRGRG